MPDSWLRNGVLQTGDSIVRPVSVALYVVALIVVVVAIDVLFFRHRSWFWERLIVNVGLVLVFLAFYLRFMRNR